MKLIIDIPEWKYKSICEGIEASKRCGVVGIDPDIHEAIYNGTPCDDMFNIVKNACSIQKLSEERVEDIKRDVWKLYKKHQSHLATYVIEFGDELKDLLGKYQEGGADNV
jgi:hypothetical protein